MAAKSPFADLASECYAIVVFARKLSHQTAELQEAVRQRDSVPAVREATEQLLVNVRDALRLAEANASEARAILVAAGAEEAKN